MWDVGISLPKTLNGEFDYLWSKHGLNWDNKHLIFNEIFLISFGHKIFY